MGTRFFCLIIVAVSIFQLSEQLENNGVNNCSITVNPGMNVHLHVNCFNPPQNISNITIVLNEPKVDQDQIVEGINKKIEVLKIKLYEEIEHYLNVSVNEFKTKLLIWANSLGTDVIRKFSEKSKTAIHALDQVAKAKKDKFIINLENYTRRAIQIYKNETYIVSVKLAEKLTELNEKIDSIKIQNVNTILHHNNNNNKVDMNSIDWNDSKVDSLEAYLASHKLESSDTKSSFNFGGSNTDSLEAQLASHELDSSNTKSSFNFGGSNTDSLEAQLASHELDSSNTKSSFNFGGSNTDSLEAQLALHELDSSNTKSSFNFGGSNTDSLEAQLASHELYSSNTKSSFNFGGSNTDSLEAQLALHELDSSNTKSSFNFGGSNTDSLETYLASHEIGCSKCKSSFDVDDFEIDSLRRK